MHASFSAVCAGAAFHRAAVLAANAEKASRLRPWSYDSVVESVREVVSKYRNLRVTVLSGEDGWAHESEAARKEAELWKRKTGRTPPALFADGRIFIDASRIEPQDVPKVILHEAVAHYGIRSIIPARHLNGFLDEAYERHHGDEGFQAVALEYFPELARDVSGEDPDAPSERRAELKTPEERRLVAEEFLAHTAEGGIRPSWWKETMARIRGYLRRLFPELRFSEAEIETALARSARHLRRSRADRLLGLRKSTVAEHRSASAPAASAQETGTASAPVAETSGTEEFQRYTMEQAKSSKKGNTIERVNENAGRDLNKAETVFVKENAIYGESDYNEKESGILAKIRDRILSFAQKNGILKAHETPSLNGSVFVSKKNIRSIVSHYGGNVKNNLIAEIPNLLKHAVLIQTEKTEEGKAHILAAKAKYGEKTYVVSMLIKENNVKRYYDHELLDLEIRQEEKTDADSGRSSSPQLRRPEPASMNNITWRALKSSGFDEKSAKTDFDADGTEPIDGRAMLHDRRMERIVQMMRPLVRGVVELDGKDLARRFAETYKEKGIEISPEDAFTAAGLARAENQKAGRIAFQKKRSKWLMENEGLWREAAEYAGGEDFLIRPSERFEGEAFHGTWISPEFNRHSRVPERKENESGEAYRKRMERRAKALKNAKGIRSDDLALAIARKTGEDAAVVERKLIEYFRNLNKPTLWKKYSDFLKEANSGKQEARLLADAQFFAQEENRVWDEAIETIRRGERVDAEWIAENRAVYEKMHKLLFGETAEIPYLPQGKALEALNEAIRKGMGRAAEFRAGLGSESIINSITWNALKSSGFDGKCHFQSTGRACCHCHLIFSLMSEINCDRGRT